MFHGEGVSNLTADGILDHRRRAILLTQNFLRTVAALQQSVNREIGGFIDLRLDGSFDRNTYAIGGHRSMVAEDFEDFEINYHTHPTRPAVRYDMPSLSDIIATIQHPEWQVNIVFAHDAIYTIYVTIEARRDLDRTVNGVTTAMRTHKFGRLDHKSVLTIFDKLESYGVFVIRHSAISVDDELNHDTIDNWPTQLELYIEPTEPDTITLSRLRTPRVQYNKLEKGLLRMFSSDFDVDEETHDQIMTIAEDINDMDSPTAGEINSVIAKYFNTDEDYGTRIYKALSKLLG